MWILVPGTLFLLEQIYRVKWIKQLRYGVTYIEKVTLLPCGVSVLYTYNYNTIHVALLGKFTKLRNCLVVVGLLSNLATF